MAKTGTIVQLKNLSLMKVCRIDDSPATNSLLLFLDPR